VKINGVDANPMCWPDGSFSVQGAAAELGITPQTVFDYLARGLLTGRQLAKGQPWQINLSDEQIKRIPPAAAVLSSYPNSPSLI
jgi:hypothetical protein